MRLTRTRHDSDDDGPPVPDPQASSAEVEAIDQVIQAELAKGPGAPDAPRESASEGDTILPDQNDALPAPPAIAFPIPPPAPPVSAAAPNPATPAPAASVPVPAPPAAAAPPMSRRDRKAQKANRKQAD